MSSDPQVTANREAYDSRKTQIDADIAPQMKFHEKVFRNRLQGVINRKTIEVITKDYEEQCNRIEKEKWKRYNENHTAWARVDFMLSYKQWKDPPPYPSPPTYDGGPSPTYHR